MTEPATRRQKWLLCALLGVIVLAVFSRGLACIFTNLDDPDYVVNNPHIRHGANWAGIKWAFTSGYAANWHPLTWLSHIVDYDLYGLKPFGHHLSSLLLHLANAVLLFLIFNRLTGALWRSAWVAAFFAIHPLRVESVVWVAERKDVLSTFFWMLTVGAYIRYAEHGKTQNPNRKIFYGLALGFFILGLMSKPMLVTLPFVLLLLDYWPLGRLQFGPAFRGRLIAEKIPFLLLAAASCVITIVVQQRAGTVTSLARIDLSRRLANAAVAYVRYAGKIFWPSRLSVFYNFEQWNVFQVSGSALLLALVTAWVVWQRRLRPYLAVGWFWFLGMLFPAIGLVQTGNNQSMADRYSYLPSVGLGLMAAWGLCDLAARRPLARQMVGLAGALALAACALLTARQITFWMTPVTLFARAAEFSDQDARTCYNIGCSVMEQGNFARAARCFERALQAAGQGDPPEFLARVRNNLGCSLLEQGLLAGAISNFQDALALQPQSSQAEFNLGRAFLSDNQPQAAVESFQRALAWDPHAAQIHFKLAGALAQSGQPAKAIAEYSETLRLRPGMDDAANSLALLLATCPDRSLRDGARAVTLARQASARSHDQNPLWLGTLAAAYAETGRLSEAADTARRARQLALAQNKAALAGVLEAQWERYQASGERARP